jgi:hypothetical protein
MGRHHSSQHTDPEIGMTDQLAPALKAQALEARAAQLRQQAMPADPPAFLAHLADVQIALHALAEVADEELRNAA